MPRMFNFRSNSGNARLVTVLTLAIMFLMSTVAPSGYAISRATDPTMLTSEGRVTFASNRDGNYEIYIMNPDGSGQTNLTNNSTPDMSPAWSPDGSKIAYVSGDPSGSTELIVMNADGSAKTNITNDAAEDITPSWSPDGSKITFASDRDGDYEIYIANANGTNPVQLTNNSVDNAFPVWSPDGSRIAYMSGDLLENNEIYVMSADGGNQTNISENAADDVTPAWSLDGSKIAFASNRGGDYDIYVMNAGGSNPTKITNNAADDVSPTWSGDGAQIMFVSGNQTESDVFVINVDGSAQTNISNNPADDVDVDWHMALSGAPSPNPINDARAFVRSHYLDFLGREPDAPGWEHWVNEISKCGSDATCQDRQRVNTSGAFFLSPEFQYTGYFIYRVYKGGLGRMPKYAEFIPEMRQVASGIVVNNQLSAAVIQANRAAYVNQFVTRADFRSRYEALSNRQYVDKLFETTGIDASVSDRLDLLEGLDNGMESRSSVLEKVVDGTRVIAEGNNQFTTTYGKAFYDKEFNPAFVQMQYFGYLRRDPDEAGFNHWLDKLNHYGNFLEAEMVRAFITSPEYKSRLGQ